MCWHFSLRTYSVDATTALRTCFLLLHKPAKCCVFLLFSHTKRDNEIAGLFCIMPQVRQMLRFLYCFLTRETTTDLRTCFLLRHKSAKCCVLPLFFLIRKTTTDLRTCFLLWHKSGKCVVFPLFSHTKDDHGLADLFSLMAQVRQILCFPSVFSHERRPRTCGLVFSYGTSPAHVAFSLCFHTRKTPADLRTCFLLKELICF